MAALQQPGNVKRTACDQAALHVFEDSVVKVGQEPPVDGATNGKSCHALSWLDNAGEEIFPSVGPLGPCPFEDDDVIPSNFGLSSASVSDSVEASGHLSQATCVEAGTHRSTSRTFSVPSRNASVDMNTKTSEVDQDVFSHARRMNLRLSTRTSNASSMYSLSSPAKMKLRAILNISLSFFGTGMLSLPKGIATFETNLTRDLMVASVLCCIVAFFAGSGFHLLGYVCQQNKAGNYVEAWNKAVGRSAARWIVIAVLVFEQYVAVCIPCGMVLADSCVSLTSPLKAHLPDALHLLIGRLGVLLFLSVLAYPVIVHKNFRRLMKVSILSTICFASVMFVIIIRYIDGSYAPGGQYWEFQQESLREATKFDGREIPLLQIMILVSLLTNALSGHAAAPAICRELPLQRVMRGQAVPEAHERNAWMIAGVVAGGFAGGGAVTMGSMIFGYLLFGVASKGNLLENFHPDDPLGIAAKVIVTCGIFTVFPLKFKPLRDYVYRIFKLSPGNQWLFRGITAAQLAAIMGPAGVLTDLGFLQAIAGATSCIFVAYFAPALMMCFHTKVVLGRSFGMVIAVWAIFCLLIGIMAVLSTYH